MSKLQWFKSLTPSPRAIVLISHGLNLNPDRLQPLIAFFQAQGAETLRLSLTGHQGQDMESFRNVTHAIWLKEAQEAYHEARRQADDLQVPLYFLGYSLSTVLFQDLMNTEDARKNPIRLDRQVLLAPALSLRKVTELLHLLRFFNDRWILPSLTYANYHAHWGTPLSAYRALFESIARVQKSGLKNSQIPTLIMMRPKDELVSFTEIEKILQNPELKSWNLVRLEERGELPIQYNHLIIDPHSLGQKDWKKMTEAISNHFFKESYPFNSSC